MFSRGWWTITERVWRWVTGYFKVHRVCVDIALHTGGQDCSVVLWRMILVIEPKRNRPVVRPQAYGAVSRCIARAMVSKSACWVQTYFRKRLFCLFLDCTGVSHLQDCGAGYSSSHKGPLPVDGCKFLLLRWDTKLRNDLLGHPAQTWFVFVSCSQSGGEWGRHWNINEKCRLVHYESQGQDTLTISYVTNLVHGYSVPDF